MNESQPPSAREAFTKAAIEGWRQQQIAALTDTQRRLYEEARRKAEEREKAKAKELADRRQADIKANMVKRLLERPQLEYILDGRRITLSEALARQLAEAYFQPDKPPDLTLLGMAVSNAAHAAAIEIERDHDRQQRVVQEKEQETTDELLRSFEQAREAQPGNRQEFARAAVDGRAETDFDKAARDDGVRQDPIRSEAIARAIARIKEKEEQEERARADRDQGRGRSLTDTFNRIR